MNVFPEILFESLQPALISHAAQSTGEPEAGVQNLFRAGIPLFAMRMAHAPRDHHELIADLLVRAGGNKSANDDMLHALRSGSMNAPALSLGQSVYSLLFPQKEEELARAVSGFSGTSMNGTPVLLALTANITAGVLGRIILLERISFQTLLNRMTDPSLSVEKLVPRDLQEWIQEEAATKNVHDDPAEIRFPEEEAEPEKGEALKWILPLLLVLLLGAGIWYWILGNRAENQVQSLPSTIQK
ncbi:MAG TPA: DUF937 domain-containing protein [Chitinophagaceae bacterium]|nr:DUF937 domain-containing protein [Chitinophagaceae bacterium]HNF70766.1 DUF937 domain-containing protein [Chitinophagaceae bacterium]